MAADKISDSRIYVEQFCESFMIHSWTSSRWHRMNFSWASEGSELALSFSISDDKFN